MKNLLVLIFCLSTSYSWSQAIYEDERYVPETNPVILEKIEQWQDLKFGLLMHWGAYSQWGIVESWSLCPEDYGWCQRKKGTNPQNYFEYKREYEDLKKTFNPSKFDPATWAKAAKDAGMKYVVFTTKHHDGFCMFDTKYTDYKVTDPDCPFSKHPKANITKELFDAFRAEGMWAGAYFSKPDWHHENYWNPYFPPFDRNVNYDPALYPEKWEKYVQFTHNQILELVTDYGKVDILWLDGGWVQKRSAQNLDNNYQNKFKEAGEGGFIKHRIVNQDIRMDELAGKVRAKQPDVLIVDRAVKGIHQNYLTPENRVPEASLPYPWESCIISGGGWSYNPEAQYMSGREGIHLLIDIVAKGGNLLLNIAPSPQGEWQQGAYELLREYGAWMKVNSEGIYNTRALAPFKEGKVAMTAAKDGSAYFFYMAEEDEGMPAEIIISSKQPAIEASVSILGSDKALKWKTQGDGFKVMIPKKIRDNPPCDFAWTIKVSQLKD
jgi:alpha-L-fucosidase